MTDIAELESEPWRFDVFNVLRQAERSFKDQPRIGDSSTRREDYVSLGQDPYMEFAASNLGRVDRDGQGRIRLFVKFLGLLGPQGALPLATTSEAYAWTLQRDDAFPRFLDVLNHRFLQLFFRAWADARPIAQHDRPDADRFHAYLGSIIGIGSPHYHDLDSVPDIAKLAFAGLLGSRIKSASRLGGFISGLFGVKAEVEEFVGTYLAFEEQDRTMIGQKNSGLGVDTLIGGSVFSVQDKIRLRLEVRDLAEFETYLPTGRRSEQLTDAVFLYLGEEFEWDVELALPAPKVEPVKLGSAGRLGWTSWMDPDRTESEGAFRTDARFDLANRRRMKRGKRSV